MYPNVTPMIYTGRKVFPKSRKDPNPKVVTIDLRWVSLLLNSTLGDKVFLVSEEDKFVKGVKEQVIKVEFWKIVQFVVEPEK